MKKRHITFIFEQLFTRFIKQAAASFFIFHFSFFVLKGQTPNVPANIGFAGMNVQLSQEARAIVQADVNALMVNKKYWEASLDRCILYFPVIEGVLIDEDIPTDFKYLAVQESSLQPDAVSTSNAIGFWQFKQETATDFGLKVDNQIDERKNIVSSTHAAAQYLKKNNQQFNNWVSSLYSFYLGAGTIAKNIPAEWSYAREIQLDGNTDRYVLRFFAHKIAIETALNRYQSASQMTLVEYPKAAGRSVESLVGELSIEEALLRSYNRWILGKNIPSDKEYVVVVPTNKINVAAIKSKVSNSKGVNSRDNFTQSDIGFPILKRSDAGDGVGAILYEINTLPGIMATNGDDAGTLSKKAKVSFGSFLRYNDMSEEDPIKAGEIYYLGKKLKKAVVPFHTVREGESLWKVSQIYGLRLNRLVKYNRINNKNQRLQSGRVLWLMEKRPRKTPVEIVETPQQEELFPKRSQPRPAVQEEATPVSKPSKIVPKTTAERKVYTPKMADTPSVSSNKPDLGQEVGEVVEKPKPTPTTTPKATTQAKPDRRATAFNPAPPADPSDRPDGGAKQPATVTPQLPVKKVETMPKLQEPDPKFKVASKEIKTEFYHAVELGQTYFSIAKMYEVTVKDIFAWNNLAPEAKLQAGQKLLIKPVGMTVATQPTTKEEFMIHTVDIGENMFRIAQKYGVKMAQIKEWNNLTEDAVKVGQQLKIKKQ